VELTVGDVTFLDRNKDVIIKYLQEIQERVKTGDIEALLVCCFPEDLGETEVSALGMSDFDLYESLGALEVAKIGLYRLATDSE